MTYIPRTLQTFLRVLFLVSLCFGMVQFVHGAEFFIGVPAARVHVGDEFTVTVMLNAGHDSINTIEGTFDVPAGFSVRGIDEKNSIVSLWIEKPELKEGAGIAKIHFAGLIPGGFREPAGKLFSIVFRAKEMSRQVFVLRDVHAFRNDGVGTEVSVTPVQKSIDVAEASTKPVRSTLFTLDKEPPELFVPIVSQDSSLFDGKWFVAFDTTDKGSGVAYYLVKEGGDEAVNAESPYLLTHQMRMRDISVTAVDKNGNTREVVVPAPWTHKYGLGVILFIIIVMWRYRVRRRKRLYV